VLNPKIRWTQRRGDRLIEKRIRNPIGRRSRILKILPNAEIAKRWLIYYKRVDATRKKELRKLI